MKKGIAGSRQSLGWFYTDYTKILLRFYTDSTQSLHRFYGNSTQILHRFHSESTQILQKFYTDSTQSLHDSTFSSEIVYSKVPNKRTGPNKSTGGKFCQIQ